VTPIAVLDYGIGNLRSAEKALQHAGADAHLTTDPHDVERAAGLVLPGVGHFGRCMSALRSSGLASPALEAVERGTPFLGICVGMQMLYDGSDESAAVTGLGILPGMVRRLPDGVKRPQMQWNTVEVGDGAKELFAGIDEPVWMYFVHSFAPERTEHTVATCEYGDTLTAVAHRDHVWATQFHPEKSGRGGLQLLANFVDLCR
jgi:glutamine amidotransferase